MNEPTIFYPSCTTAVELTKPHAVPLNGAMRKQYERQLAESEAVLTGVGADIRRQQTQLARLWAVL